MGEKWEAGAAQVSYWTSPLAGARLKELGRQGVGTVEIGSPRRESRSGWVREWGEDMDEQSLAVTSIIS